MESTIENTTSIHEVAANNIRILSAAMVEKAASGHPGGAMGGADFMHILFSEFLKYDPDDATWFYRDRFFLDPGHMSPMLYASLSLLDRFTMDELSQFRQWGSPTPGHPEKDFSRGIENTSGPLGQGHTMAVGAAIAERFLAQRFGEWTAHNIYAYISDGGIQEEISQGAGRIAGHLGLHNLIMFYDANNIQLSTTVEEVTSEDVAMKYKSWNWLVININGHDHDAIRAALKQANEEKERPTIIIAKTVMGKGAVDDNGNSFENKTSTHGQPLGKAGASINKTIENLGGDAQNPFVIFEEVKEYYKEVAEKNRAYRSDFEAKKASWEKGNPELRSKLEQFISGKAPEIDIESIDQKPNTATRAASSSVLGYLAEHVDNMIVASADLSNSDKTDGFLKKTTALKKDDFSGKFLQAGVSELTMAAMSNGMALHGGVIPVCGTFFVFSDYMKPAIRLSALMELPVIYIWTHDAFRVGEDGPTHQPVEHEAQIRLLEKLKNHKGNPSLLALRPADAEETSVAWHMALNNVQTPTALLLSRQNIKNLPDGAEPRKIEAWKAKFGAYLVVENENPNIVFVGNGSEVATLVAAAEQLKEKHGTVVNVVSVISESLFRQQPASYQNKVIQHGKPALGLTAGLPDTLDRLVGMNGKVLALDHFGYSAPAEVLDEKFGFTPDNVYNHAKEMLNIDSE